jgi:glycosyltransferase involved in cell wall biosynthesis
MDDYGICEMEKKRVALVVNSSWNIFNFRLNLIRGIQAQGYEVILIAPYDKYSEILKKEFKYFNIKINNKGTNPIEDIRTFMEFYTIYKLTKPDLVLHFTIKPNIYGSLACRLLGIKTINNIAGLGTLFIKDNLMTSFAKLLYKFSQEKVDKVFFQNKDDYKMFIINRLVKQAKSSILPGSGVDVSRFKPIEYHKKDNIFRFLLVGRMLWDKGVGEYIEAIKIIKTKYDNVEFQLLGFLDVDNRASISKKQMNKWVDDDLVNYLGISDDVKKEISKVDCIVLPSFYREGTPKSLLEGASMAKPIITTDNVGCRDVVDDGVNGYLCKIKDSKDLAKKMQMMLNLSKSELKKMGENGRNKMIMEFNERIVIDNYLDVLTEKVPLMRKARS